MLFPVTLALAVAFLPPTQSAEQGAAWPQAGSRAEYGLQTSFMVPDGSYRSETMATLSLTYDGEAWSGTCAGETTEVLGEDVTRSVFSSPSAGEPATAPRDARLGETVTLALLDDPGIAEDCQVRGETVTVTDWSRRATTAEELSETSPYQDVTVAWDRDSGLVLDWTRLTHGGSSVGRLVDTDAFGR